MKQNVMLIQANHIMIKGLKACHSKPIFWANCTGNVFALDNCNDIVIENCDINGCGRIGVYILSSTNVILKNNLIHNNSLCAVQLNDSNLFEETNQYINYIQFIANKIYKNGDTKKIFE